jgi:ferredoxin
MVCIVRDKRSGNFIPSCSALAMDGMDIDASGEDVIALRKKAVELLLLEHRAECEAQCRIVCPAGYNIPLMNRLLTSGNIAAALELSLTEMTDPEIRCKTCPGYCENACRRKKIDLPVSIKNIKLFVSRNISSDKYPAQFSSQTGTAGVRKRYSSRIGQMEDIELREWTRECREDLSRFREIVDFQTAASEAGSCMHCDCRAAESCKLRDLAEEFSLKDPKGKLVNAPISKKINGKTGLIFENAKCIKCGLCVRVCEDSKEEPALCFINRGFVSIISEPLTEEFDGILATKSDICIDICPTGALSRF